MNYRKEVTDDLNEKLEQIEREEIDTLRRAEMSVHQIDHSLAKLREHVVTNGFPSQEEEILFFKEIKPSVYSKRIYFAKVYHIEVNRPVGRACIQKKYFLKAFREIEIFFKENVPLYRYYRENQTFLDDKLFVRGMPIRHLLMDPFYHDADPEFSTYGDYFMSRILANKLLNDYLKKELAAIEQQPGYQREQEGRNKYSWTAPLAHLVELGYGWYASKSVNDGDVHISEIMRLLESMFDVDLGDYYHTFLTFKTRKNPTHYLDHMKDHLLEYMDEEREE